jgi:hypothetical protein
MLVSAKINLISVELVNGSKLGEPDANTHHGILGMVMVMAQDLPILKASGQHGQGGRHDQPHPSSRRSFTSSEAHAT